MSILRADSIRDRAGTGAPDFPNGLTGNVTGTATTATLANTATVATNAQGITGTPNITVGTVGCGNVTSSGNISATDATFSGNLTVNGTTTTIDTAVTSVDSLAVDGNITALGRLGIGTDNTSAEVLTVSGVDAFIRVDRSNNNPGIDLRYQGSSTNRVVIDATTTGDLRFATGGSTERVRIASSGTAIFKAGLAEKVNVKTQFAGANSTAITDGNVILTTTAEPGNTYPNITGVHTVLSSGEGFSITIALKVNGSGTINNFYIDGVPQNIEWSGGSAPSAGASGYDVFTFSAMKTGTGTSDYTVFGAATNYA
jgi:hypothetical protein